MSENNLKQYALKLRKELQEDYSPETARRIGVKIRNATYSSGTPLSMKDKDHIINYIENPAYDHKTGRKPIFDSDNSEFLKLVALVMQTVKGGK